MAMPRMVFVLIGLALCCVARAGMVELPVSFDEHLSIELVAQEPEIVTPTGVAVDARGRIWVIENNTHFAPKNYRAMRPTAFRFSRTSTRPGRRARSPPSPMAFAIR